MKEVIDVDITQSMARIAVNGKDISFTSVGTSLWNHRPVNNLVILTKQRVAEFYQFMWSQVTVTLQMYFLDGMDLMRFARVTGINESIMGEHIYYFFWG